MDNGLPVAQEKNDKALHILRTVFGYDEFRSRQQEVIEELIAGGDALVLMPTGGGKSLCYQIPAIVRAGTGIVVSPLIALMQDQVGALVQSGARAAFLNSSQDAAEGRAVEDKLLAGELDLLYVAPERLTTPRFLDLIGRVELSLFAIDEAHCVSQWGHDFRRDYLQLDLLHERFPSVPRIALTATADDTTRLEIIKRLALDDAKVVVCGFDRPNIRYRVTIKDKAKDQLLRFIEDDHVGASGIVYCMSRKKVDSTAQWLADKGHKALPYHAGMTTDERQRHQDRFLKEDGVIVVATIAFGLGIDKPDVRFVAHLDMPKSMEAYYQETGRAGRDGLPAEAWMAYGMQDIVMVRRLIEGSEAGEERKRVERRKLDALVAYCEAATCRRAALLLYLGESPPESCGNCDTCLEPVETWDGTVAAQKALSCVVRTGQRFGAAYVTDVLLGVTSGNASERITSLGHDRLSTFGIGGELDGPGWRSVIRQLVARNLLATDAEGYGTLRLTEAASAVLKGDEKVHLRKEKKVEKKPRRRRRDRGGGGGEAASVPSGEFPDTPENRTLWEALRERRTELAREQGVPPYVIFHDATFAEMVSLRPRTLEDLRQITGVGERKLELYGEEFLKIVSEHSALHYEEEEAGDTAVKTLELFKSGIEIEAIAVRRGLKPSTIYGHLAGAIEEGALELVDVMTIAEDDLGQIREALLERPREERALKPVFEATGGAFTYETLRCVRATLLRAGWK